MKKCRIGLTENYWKMKNNIMYHWKVFVMFLSSSTLYNVQCTFLYKVQIVLFHVQWKRDGFRCSLF